MRVIQCLIQRGLLSHTERGEGITKGSAGCLGITFKGGAASGE